MPPRHIAILGGGLTAKTTGRLGLQHRTRPASRRPRLCSPRRRPAHSPTVVKLRPRAGVLDPPPPGSPIRSSPPPKSSPAAKNRYLHVPGTPGIYKIPGPRLSYLWSELRFFIQPGINFELVRGWNRPEGVLDESLESFLTRRGHAITARVLGSAIGHGIYAADARLLSVRAAFPKLWELEEKGKGRILWYLLTRGKKAREEEKQKADEEQRQYQLGDVPKLMDGVSVYSFRDGMGTLADALGRAVAKNPNIRMLPGTEVTGLRFDDEHGFEISTDRTNPLLPSHIVSALPLPALAKLIPDSHPLPYLTTNPASSVTAINLVFPGTKIFPRGFGDTLAPGEGITKVTVMMGGPHRLREGDTALPVVLAHLQYHLNRRAPLPTPLVTRTWQHKECIPTPLPGHLERMKKLKEALDGQGWEGRMEVVGAGVRGVSLGDCVESGRGVGSRWA
ncbi:Protoporphyrinogen oxidase [Mycena venus]|uniref:Protoporphyrinogen oxidase n=1 Tax=Mycena venus TaxID=2733690 RepID=A0A8H7D6D7_9AGAR|nr:Protoporphyrinogen oxidase [Mycena venus]